MEANTMQNDRDDMQAAMMVIPTPGPLGIRTAKKGQKTDVTICSKTLTARVGGVSVGAFTEAGTSTDRAREKRVADVIRFIFSAHGSGFLLTHETKISVRVIVDNAPDSRIDFLKAKRGASMKDPRLALADKVAAEISRRLVWFNDHIARKYGFE